MKIALIGASENALVIAAFFKLAKIDATIFDFTVSPDATEKMTVKGAQFPNATVISIQTIAQFNECYDYIFIFSPITNNLQLIPLIKKHSTNKTMILSFLENLTDDALINSLFPLITKSAVCHFHASKKNDDTILLTTDPQEVKLHAFDISSPHQLHQNELEELKHILDFIGQTKIIDERMDIKWSQALFSVSIDRLAKALNCQYGDILHHSDALLIAIHLADEIVRIAKKQKVNLTKTTGINYNKLLIDSDTKQAELIPIFKSMLNSHRVSSSSFTFPDINDYDLIVDLIHFARLQDQPTPYLDLLLHCLYNQKQQPFHENIQNFIPLIHGTAI